MTTDLDEKFGELRSLLHEATPGAHALKKIGDLVLGEARVSPDRVQEQWLPYVEEQLGAWPTAHLSVPVTLALFELPQRVRTALIKECARLTTKLERKLEEHIARLCDERAARALTPRQCHLLGAWCVDSELRNDDWLDLASEHFSESDIYEDGGGSADAFSDYVERCDDVQRALSNYAVSVGGPPPDVFMAQLMFGDQDEGMLIAKIGDLLTEHLAHQRFAELFNARFGTSFEPLDVVRTSYPGVEPLVHEAMPEFGLSRAWFDSEQMKSWHAQLCTQVRRLVFYDYKMSGKLGDLMASEASAWSKLETSQARRAALRDLARATATGYFSVDLYDMFSIYDGALEFDEDDEDNDAALGLWFQHFGDAYGKDLRAQAVALAQSLCDLSV